MMSRQVGRRLPYCSLKSNGGWHQLMGWTTHLLRRNTCVSNAKKQVVGKWWRTFQVPHFAGRWWQLTNIFLEFFTPNVWGFMIPFDGCIFFLLNHQPDKQKSQRLLYIPKLIFPSFPWCRGSARRCAFRRGQGHAVTGGEFMGEFFSTPQTRKESVAEW